MNTSVLTERYVKHIKGVLHCFDRLVLFGTYKAIGGPGAMGRHLQQRGPPASADEDSSQERRRPEIGAETPSSRFSAAASVHRDEGAPAPAVLRPLVCHFRVVTARRRSGNSVRQISQTVPSQPRAVQCSRP